MGSILDVLANYNPTAFVQGNQLREQAIGQGQLQSQETQQDIGLKALQQKAAQQQLNDAEVFKQAYSSTDGSPEKVRDYMLRNGISGGGFQAWQKHDLELRTKAAALTKEQRDIEKQTHDQAGDIIDTINAVPDTSQQAALYRQSLPRLQQLAPDVPWSPDYQPDYGKFVSGALGHASKVLALAKERAGIDQSLASTEHTKAQTASENAALPGVVADTIQKQVLAASQTLATSKNQADYDQKRAQLPPEVAQLLPAVFDRRAVLNAGMKPAEQVTAEQHDQTFGETRRHNTVEEGQGGQRLKYEGARVGLEARRVANEERMAAGSDEASVDMKAEAVLRGAKLSDVIRGQGKAATAEAQRIMNRVAEKQPGFDLVGAQSGLRADSGSLASLQKNRDQVSAFEATAGKNLDQFLQMAKGVVDSGIPLVNSPLRLVSDRLAGSDKAVAFNTARQVAVTEIAKVLSNPGLSGQLSDSARHEVQGLIGPNATLKQIYTAAAILKQDMKNRGDSMDAQLKEIKDRISKAPSTPAPTGTRPPLSSFEKK